MANNSWKKWLYVLAVIALIAWIATLNWTMLVLAVLLVLAAYLIKNSPANTNIPSGVKPKSRKKKR